MSIARYYDEAKNPDGAGLPGVPLADISEEEWEAYPTWLKESIDAAPFFRKTKLDAPKRRAEAEKE